MFKIISTRHQRGNEGTMSYFVRDCDPIDMTIDFRTVKYDRFT